MENQILDKATVALLRECADECTINAQKCKEQELHDCAKLCLACATACHKAITEGANNPDVIDDCEAACNACATECELHPHQHCMDCAEICRECEIACKRLTGFKAIV